MSDRTYNETMTYSVSARAGIPFYASSSAGLGIYAANVDGESRIGFFGELSGSKIEDVQLPGFSFGGRIAQTFMLTAGSPINGIAEYSIQFSIHAFNLVH